jgi:DNA-binding XRE family transcriptional regulator
LSILLLNVFYCFSLCFDWPTSLCALSVQFVVFCFRLFACAVLENHGDKAYTALITRCEIVENSDGQIKREHDVTQPKALLTLQQARLKQALGLSELAKRANVSLSAVMKIEAGTQPRMLTIRKLAAALGCEPQDIAWPGDPFAGLK